MFDQTLREIMNRNVLVTVRPETSVTEVSRAMANAQTGVVVVIDGNTPAGIFSERDMVFRVVARELDPEKTCVSKVMTAPMLTLPPDATYGLAMTIMHERGFRHIPVIEGGQVIGIVSARNALDPELEEFVSEERRREHWGKQAREM